MNTVVRYKSVNKSTLANAYNVSLHIMQQWLKPIQHDLGEYIGVFNPKQVSKIVEHLGVPEDMDLICV